METMSQEALEMALEKAKRALQEKLDQMTPEERAMAEKNAQKLIEADRASMQQTIAAAAKIAAGAVPDKAPKFCTNCGAPVSGGKFCPNCGRPL